MLGEVFPKPRPVLLKVTQPQVLVESTQLHFRISDQILIAQFVEVGRINELATFV